MIDIDNNEYFDCFQFPGGEWGVKWNSKKIEGFFLSLLARINSGNDLVKLLTVTDILKRKSYKIRLYIPYFPGARQDRISNVGEPLSIKIYTDIINAQQYFHVNILDPHSDVTPALLNNCIIEPIYHIIRQIVDEGHYDTILIPDAGATKKMFSYYFPTEESRKGLTFVQCLKKRDTLTGKLSGFRIVDEIPQIANCLICDDIGDGCGTFSGLVQEILKDKPPTVTSINKIGLYVTHGIFSKGVEYLLSREGGFDEIYTTNSIRDNQPEGVKVYQI